VGDSHVQELWDLGLKPHVTGCFSSGKGPSPASAVFVEDMVATFHTTDLNPA